MTVTVQTPFTEYIAAPSATTFATTFRLIEPGDLLVTVNGAIVTSGFAVGGLPLGPTASVVFTVPMVGGEAVRLERVVKLERQNNYQFEGDFQADVINQDWDRPWMALQDFGAKFSALYATVFRTLRAPLGEVLNELPAAAVRANKVQAFDSSGQPIAVLPGTGTASEVLINIAGTGAGQGGKIVGFIQQGAGAVPRTVETKLRERVSVEDFRQPGDTDDVQMFERAVALYVGLGYGGEILAKANVYNFNLRKLVVNGVAITIKLGRHTVINHNTPDFICMDFTGIGCQLDGGRRGGIIGPAVYAPDTGATSPTYAVIRATGDYFEASNFKLLNVRQLGVLTKDIDHCNIHDFDIDCNITDPVIPLVTTFHCGVFIDPGSATLEHSLRVHDGFIKTGIQGVFVGNYGTGITARAVLINDMIFSNMWDHGVYSNYTTGMVCVNITANNCHTPIAASGSYNMVKNLTVNNELLPAPINIRNTGSAVSMRDARYCIVDGVTINGYGSTAEPDVIGVDFREFTGVGLVGNLVSNINMRVATGTAQAVRFFTTTPNSGMNRVEDIFYEGALAANKGVVDFVGSTAQEINTVDNVTAHVTGGADSCSLLNFQNQIGSSATNLKMKLNFDASAAMNMTMVAMVACVETKASELRPYIAAAKGINVGLFGVREFTSGARNEAEKIKVPLLEGLTSFTPTLAFSGTTKMLIEYEGDAVPTASCRAGSKYIRRTGGASTTMYLNRIDGNNWFAVA